ncbi:MAG TPA: hypothetical protein VMQ86_09775 [Bryobacteraceae bacterium]|nr:hypothetical protein [Bryobacteraceae bacterium]
MAQTIELGRPPTTMACPTAKSDTAVAGDHDQNDLLLDEIITLRDKFNLPYLQLPANTPRK